MVLSCKKNKNGKIKLTIAENGYRLPPEFSLEKVKSPGMNLVHSLVYNQSEGTLTLKEKRDSRQHPV